MAKLDPTQMADWQIAEAAEGHMKTVYELGEELGLEKMELLPYGHYVAKLDYLSILERLKDRPNGKNTGPWPNSTRPKWPIGRSPKRPKKT